MGAKRLGGGGVNRLGATSGGKTTRGGGHLGAKRLEEEMIWGRKDLESL